MANDFKFGAKNIPKMYFGNKSVLQVYFGNKLIWPTLNLIMGEGNFICIEYIPKNNETINNATVFLNDGRVNGWMWIMHESGLCIARSTTESYETKTLHNCSGYTAYSTNFSSPTLLKDNVYYFCFKTGQYDNDGNTFAYYSGKTGNYKKHRLDGGEPITDIDLNENKFVGIDTQFSDFYGKWKNNYLIYWNGGNDIGTDYGLLKAKRDNSHIKGQITDAMLNACTSDAQRWALPFYLIGNVENNELVLNNYNAIRWRGHVLFENIRTHIIKGNSNITKNHITSLTPVTMEAPQNPIQGDIYYKSADCTWDSISYEAVVAWSGSEWEDASRTNLIFDDTGDTKDDMYERLGNYTVDNFARSTLYNDKKFYLAVNGVEY